MEISKIRIKNYRSIKDTGDLSLTKLFALIGQNNTGKSSVLKAIEVLWGKISIKETDFHKNTKEDIEIEITLKNFNEEKYKEFQNENGVAEIKFIQPHNAEASYLLNGVSATKTKIKKLPELLVISDIRNPQGESTCGKSSFSKEIIGKIEINSEENVKGSVKIEEIKKKKLEDSTQEEIKNFLAYKREDEIKKVSEEITKKFQEILISNDFALRISTNVEFSNDYNTMLFFPKDKKRNEVEILACGTGLQSILILALLEVYAKTAQCNDSIFLVEEPEVYLHPKYQRKMFSALRDIASFNQVIYTTHSPIMISEVWADRSVRLSTLVNGETNINEIEIEDIINELGIRYEDFLNSGVVVFVEGENDIDFFRFIVQKLRPKIDKIDRRITFIFSDGFRNIHYYAFMQILTSQNVSARFRVIVDSDGQDLSLRKSKLLEDIKGNFGNRQEEEVEETIKKIEDNIVVLNKYSIESYFLNSELLNSAFPDIEKDDFEYMVNHYGKIYKEHIEKLKNSKETLQHFRGYLKPKNIFIDDDVRKNQNKYNKFEEVFENDTKFFEVRSKLVEKCKEIKKNGGNLVNFLLSDGRVENEIFSEPISIIKKILDETENEN